VTMPTDPVSGKRPAVVGPALARSATRSRRALGGAGPVSRPERAARRQPRWEEGEVVARRGDPVEGSEMEPRHASPRFPSGARS
jgi:hypothetical protein